ncbi:voltage-dependent T-type calcium channel subunit alpha-1G isoform X1 [Eurosta solidaginis]|uniref:voltage-dependent T-type calcium channel subunit alpha-1G isoform X1 n=1 Tax=Eurosta solidaginis TaxID=178769 RepID=UPI003530B39B
MYQPCEDEECKLLRCRILQIFDDIIFVFFAIEMLIKMIAMGLYGKNTYMADSWNRLDFFIVVAGLLEYVMNVDNLNLTAIRTIRVLRPLRAINRIPSMRILVMLLLDTLPMLGNVLLLCFFVFFIFGIIGVQLWQGILRQRCWMADMPVDNFPALPKEYRVRVRVNSVSNYYEFSKEQDYICSKPEDSGMHLCKDLPPYRVGDMICTEPASIYGDNLPTNTSCVNWNQYYTECREVGNNPFQGTISFDNIGMAWVAIFLVISLEGWTDIMYYVQDAHSFWDWIYFVLLIVIGSFFMINLCLVVIATQFSETKKREMERMRQERARYTSTSTLASSTNNSEPATCYAEIVKYIAHLWRRFKRRMLKKYQKQQRKEGLLPNADNLTFSPSRIKCHHPKCPKYGNRKPSSIQDQMITVMVPLNSNNNNVSNSSNNNNNGTCAATNGVRNHQMATTAATTTIAPSTTTTTTIAPTTIAATTLTLPLTTTTNPTNAATTATTPLLNGTMTNTGYPNNNGQQQQQSSSENSVQSIEQVTRNSNLKKSANHLTPDAVKQQVQSSPGQIQQAGQQKTILLKFPANLDSEQLILQLANLGKSNPCTSGFLSPPTSASRRPSVMFNEYVLLHTPPAISDPLANANTTTTAGEKNAVCSSEKMTQAGDGSIWQVNLPQPINSSGNTIANPYTDCSELGIHDAMTCQELLAFSVAFSAALPTGQSTLESFYTSLARCDPHTAEALKNQHNRQQSQLIKQQQPNSLLISERQCKRLDNSNTVLAITSNAGNNTAITTTGNYIEDYSCCYDLYQNALSPLGEKKQRSKAMRLLINVYRFVMRICGIMRRHIKLLVEHKYFQQGILLAILINTLSMGIEYHDQPPELTAIVEKSNIVFSAIFAVEMLLKVVAEGPFRYIANGFNVFDGVIVILSVVEIFHQLRHGNGGGGSGGSGLSVLRTFRLLRILKLVRFMPNLRRQLFVMLRTMDNVAVFFSLLVLFIFIFSILGMYLFGGKFCKFVDDTTGLERECTCPEIISKHPQCECDRKHFNNILWATVTVFQILTQEDWNVVLFNGMEKTSHWAALYFVALMTFGNYVLFNLLVAILVEGFSSERNERREREQRELVKKLREETLAENFSDAMYDESHSSEADSSTTNESLYEVRNRWHSAEDMRKLQDSTELIMETKSNMQKQQHQRMLLQPTQDYQINESYLSGVGVVGGSSGSGSGSGRKSSDKDATSRISMEDDKKKNLKKTYSIRERRGDAPRLSRIRPLREPPIITTTAATPQDSPNTTLEGGMSFRSWNAQELEMTDGGAGNQCPGSPSLLKPPTLFSGQRSLDEGIPSIDLIPPSPVLTHKPLNILNASQLKGSNTNPSSCNNLVPKSSSLLPSAISSSNSSVHSVVIDDISKNSDAGPSGPIFVPTTISAVSTPRTPLPNDPNTGGGMSTRSINGFGSCGSVSAISSIGISPLTAGVTIGSTTATAVPPPAYSTPATSNNEAIHTRPSTNASATSTISPSSGMQRISSLKRFRRSSSKRKKKPTTDAGSGAEDDDQQQLNNGSDNSCLLTPHSNGGSSSMRSDTFLSSTTGSAPLTANNQTTQQQKTKDTNRLSPQNSIRRLSTTLSIGSIPPLGSRRASACIFNSQLYQNLNQPPKLYAPTAAHRRMSSFELAFSKNSHLNLHNLEANRKSMSYTNSKLDLDKWQKSYTNMQEPDMLQQYIQEREKRKSSISQYTRQQHQQQKPQQKLQEFDTTEQLRTTEHAMRQSSGHMTKLKMLIERLKPTDLTEKRETYSLYIFAEDNRFRIMCSWFVNQKWFDNVVLLFIALNCITLAMERPNIPPTSTERLFLATANYVFTAVFTVEMLIKVVSTGMFYGPDAYFTSGWNIMDGSLVIISIIDLLMSLFSQSSPKIFGILRVFRLLRSLRPLRVINRAPGLKLVVQTLLSSLRPIGNIVLICCTFFIIFGILGVQLFKGTFYFCEGENIKQVRTKADCYALGYEWKNRKYNFDDLGKALMSLFVLSSRDGWVNIMYTGLDAVGEDMQPIVNYNEWRLLYFISFILLVGFFVLNMFVGVVVENFHRCREEQEKEEKIRRAAKRALQMEKKRRRMHDPPYYINYSPSRMFIHNVVTSKYFDLAIAAVIGLNVVTMAMEYYGMKDALTYTLKVFNYFFTAVFILEANMKVLALGWPLYLKDRWNQLDVGIVLLSVIGIVLEEWEEKKFSINPTIIRVMRVLRIARVLKLLKMAKGMRALLDTVMQALPQVGNLGLLFFLLFFIFAALGVELFGRLECSEKNPCQGLGEHAHFANFGMAFLTLFRVATGDNWNGIMKDTLRDECDNANDCVRDCCVSPVIAPIFFVIFVLMAQFVLVNVVVAVLMKHLEESHKQMEDEMDMEVELERELVREQEFEREQKLCQQLEQQTPAPPPVRQLNKIKSLPKNFTYSTPSLDKKFPSVLSGIEGIVGGGGSENITGISGRRQTIQYFNQPNGISLAELGRGIEASVGAAGGSSGTSGGGGGGASEAGISALSPKALSSRLCVTAAENSFDTKLQLQSAAGALGRRGRRSSTAFRSKRGLLAKERSLDEQATRRRTLESKRMSCDSLPWGGDGIDFRRGTIFESLESDGAGSPSSTYDVRSICSEDVAATAAAVNATARNNIASDALSIASASLISEKTTMSISGANTTTAATGQSSSGAASTSRRIYGRSQSTDQSCIGGNGRGGLLSVPRSMPPRSRSGSTKQLFKQQALDEDPDMDENTLLLPIVVESSCDVIARKNGGSTHASNGNGSGHNNDKVKSNNVTMLSDNSASSSGNASIPMAGDQLGLSKSDSAEIMRIISERRLMDQRDNSGNEDSDYNDLLLVKSPYSSTDC